MLTILKLHNTHTELVTDDQAAREAVKIACCITYQFFYRQKGWSKAKSKTRELCYFDEETQSFPAGWTGKVITALRRIDVSAQVEDARVKPEKINLQMLAIPNRPWRHQIEALEQIQDHERGIVVVPTRGGKTLIMAMAISAFSVPSLILVPNKTLLQQEYDFMCQVFGARKVGRLGGGYADYKAQIVVATVQTLHSRIDNPEIAKWIFRSRKCVIFDECHHIKNGGYEIKNTYFKVAQRCERAYYRLGFTATPGSTNSIQREILTAATGNMIYSCTIDELKNDNVLTPAKVVLIVVKRPHTMTLREYLEERNIPCPPRANLEAIFKKWKLPVPRTPTFGEELEAKITKNDKFKRLIVNITSKLRDEGKSVILTVSRVEDGVNVFSDPESEFYIEESEGLSGQSKHRKEVLERFREGQIKVLVSTLIKEGVDIPRADALVMAACDVMDSIPVMQRVGRVLTKHSDKEQAIIIDFYIVDGGGVLERHSKERLALYNMSGFEIEITNPKEFLA